MFTLVLVSATSRVSFAPNCKTVTFPPGTYLSGPIKFSSSSQTLEVQQGARVLAAWNRYGRMDPHNFSTTWPLGPLEPGERARAHALFLSLSLFAFRARSLQPQHKQHTLNLYERRCC